MTSSSFISFPGSNLMRWLLLLIIPFSLSSCGYNSMVEKRQGVDAAWSQVQNVYQRRTDLIPNLVATVKGAANFEKSTLVEVTEARAKATSIQLKADDLTPENMAKYQQAQDQLSGALSRLLVASENYPDLKANENFRELAAEVAGSENRIAVERQKFNLSVQDYNTYIQKFPNNLFAGMFGFKEKAYFQATAGADTAPKIDFGS